MKTSELTGPALDWAVAKCEGAFIDTLDDTQGPWVDGPTYVGDLSGYNPTVNWAQGGPIIEREKITLEWTGEDWMAYIRHDEEFFGPTPLIAAMRCYVTSKLGDEVEVPDELA